MTIDLFEQEKTMNKMSLSRNLCEFGDTTNTIRMLSYRSWSTGGIILCPLITIVSIDVDDNQETERTILEEQSSNTHTNDNRTEKSKDRSNSSKNTTS